MAAVVHKAITVVFIMVVECICQGDAVYYGRGWSGRVAEAFGPKTEAGGYGKLQTLR